jgi:hypothetical protein
VVNKNMPAMLISPVSTMVIPISVAVDPPITVVPISVGMRESRTREMWMGEVGRGGMGDEYGSRRRLRRSAQRGT